MFEVSQNLSRDFLNESNVKLKIQHECIHNRSPDLSKLFEQLQDCERSFQKAVQNMFLYFFNEPFL